MSDKPEFSKLDKIELSILAFLRSTRAQNIGDIRNAAGANIRDVKAVLSVLKKENCVRSDAGGTLYSITEFGNYRRMQLIQKRHDIRVQKYRYWITTGIALLALAKSFLPEISAAVRYLLESLQ